MSIQFTFLWFIKERVQHPASFVFFYKTRAGLQKQLQHEEYV